MQSKHTAVTVAITQDDIDAGEETFMHNPLALALARTLKMQGVFVSRSNPLALEMCAPYRTIYLPPAALGWLNNYASQDARHPAQPSAFEVSLDDDSGKPR